MCNQQSLYVGRWKKDRIGLPWKVIYLQQIWLHSQPTNVTKHPPGLLPSRMNSVHSSSQVHNPQGLIRPSVMVHISQLTDPNPVFMLIAHIRDTPGRVSACINKQTSLNPMSLSHHEKCTLWAQLPTGQLQDTPPLSPSADFVPLPSPPKSKSFITNTNLPLRASRLSRRGFPKARARSSLQIVPKITRGGTKYSFPRKNS